MRQKFERDIRAVSSVTLKFRTTQDAAYLMQDIEDNGIGAMPNDIESVTIRETRVITLTSEQLAFRRRAANAARDIRMLVATLPDPRD